MSGQTGHVNGPWDSWLPAHPLPRYSINQRNLMNADEEQSEIDYELLFLQRRIYELRIRRNDLARISRLPNELLVDVFFKLKNTNYTIPYFRSWHRIAHVCRRWRRVALGATDLWTNPPTRRQEYTVLMLKRSGIAPLHIDMMPLASIVTTTAIFDNIQRISSLVLHDNVQHLREFEAALSSSTHTVLPLQDLQILHQPKAAPLLFQLLLTGATTNLSSLSSLTLENILFDWDILPIRTLTSLSIERAYVNTSLPWKDFGAALREMKLLATLKLNLATLNLHTADHISLSSPHLRQLSLYRVPPTQLGYFLGHSHFPRLEQFHVMLEAPYSSPFSSISNVLWTLYEQGNFGRFDRMVWDIGVSLTRASPTRTDKLPSFKIGFTLDSLPLKDFLQHLPRHISQEITHLDLSFFETTTDTLSNIFESLPNVRCLDVWLSRSLIGALVVRPAPGIDVHVPLPLLRSIRIGGILERSDPSERNSSNGPDSKNVEAFCRCLEIRGENGAGIDDLSFIWGELSPRDKGLLAQFMKARRS